jgi:hypothetical protein
MGGPPEDDASRARWTLGKIRALNLQLEARCQAPGCPWFGALDLDALIAKVGPDYELPDDPGFACENCGAAGLKFELACLHPDNDNERKRE